MKKLMVLVAAIALAIAGQAANVNWKLNVAGQGAAWNGAGAYVMAFNGSDYDAVIKLLTVTGSDNMATDLGAYALSGNGLTQFAVGSNRGAASTTGSASAGVSGNDLFWVVFTEGSMDASKAIQWTAATDVSTMKFEDGSPAPGTFAVTSFANSGTIASVPEPTSGILLLIGMAGLALRRKRA